MVPTLMSLFQELICFHETDKPLLCLLGSTLLKGRSPAALGLAQRATTVALMEMVPIKQ